MTVRLALLGCGSHCHNEHLPALRRLRDETPHLARLVAVCDKNLDLAEQVAAVFPGARVFEDVNALIAAGDIDGIIAVTPATVTAHIAQIIMAAGIPLLMEKPLGASMDEALRGAEKAVSGVMVGMNRRFDPLWAQASRLLQEYKPSFVRYSLRRQGRSESGFIADVSIHALDGLGATFGAIELMNRKPLPGLPGEALMADLRCGDVYAALECFPTVGVWDESIDAVGDGWHLKASWGEGLEMRFHRKSKQPALFVEPSSKGESTWQETLAFIDAINGTGPWQHPRQRCLRQ